MGKDSSTPLLGFEGLAKVVGGVLGGGMKSRGLLSM